MEHLLSWHFFLFALAISANRQGGCLYSQPLSFSNCSTRAVPYTYTLKCAPHNYEGALKFAPLWCGGSRFIFLKWLSSSKTIITYSVLRQVHSLFQSELSSECDPVRPLPMYSIISIPQSHPAAAYVFFLVTSTLPSILSCVTWFRRQFLHKMWPIQLAFLPFTVCMIFLSSMILCNTSSFLIRSVQLIFPILLQQHTSKTFQVFLIYFPSCPSFITTQSYAPNVALY